MDIVICDDCPARATSIAEQFEREGHVVIGIFHSSDDCLARCTYLPPNAVALGPGLATGVDASRLRSALDALGLAVMVPNAPRSPDHPDLKVVRDHDVEPRR